MNNPGKIIDSNHASTTITTSEMGHMLHHNNVFSHDDQWIIFDGRNDDTKIGETDCIAVVNVATGAEKVIYRTPNQTKYGPGVGAVSFSPTEDIAIFIHGLYNADPLKPYDLTRRFGLAVRLDSPMVGIHMDARDMHAPYVAGSLRGGTHSHCWSGDGSMLSFTYNDELVDPDLRVVGVMVPAEGPIVVPKGGANNDGLMYSAILTNVVREPKAGSDEISRAFDECWVGKSGYTNSEGKGIAHAIAFQGHTRNEKGETITEIFVVDVDADRIRKDTAAVGKSGERPQVPAGLQQRRISHTVKGLSDLRHWLRSSADGKYIYALAKDEQGRNQIVQCHVNTGEYVYVSAFDFSINSPINISYKGDKITFVSNNNVYLFDITKKDVKQLTSYTSSDLKVVGAPVFSRRDDKIVYNQFVETNGKEVVQIKVIQMD